MYCKVHKPSSTPGAATNKGSCQRLTSYLSKEGEDENRPYYDNFFSGKKDFVKPDEVLEKIDNNVKTLKRKDDKFYMLTINPSHHELQCLIKKVTGKVVEDFNHLLPFEQNMVLAEMKEFARDCMDKYAVNFYREKVRSKDDIIWFGRVETERHYKNQDEKVKSGEVQVGEKKEGLQLHVHVIVSRMDKTQKVSLSPLTRSRGNKQILDGKVVVKGFDRSEWANKCNETFNTKYQYVPQYVRRKEDWENYMEKSRMVYQIESNMKRMLLVGHLHAENKTLSIVLRTLHFAVNQTQAFSKFLMKNSNKISNQNE